MTSNTEQEQLQKQRKMSLESLDFLKSIGVKCNNMQRTIQIRYLKLGEIKGVIFSPLLECTKSVEEFFLTKMSEWRFTRDMYVTSDVVIAVCS